MFDILKRVFVLLMCCMCICGGLFAIEINKLTAEQVEKATKDTVFVLMSQMIVRGFYDGYSLCGDHKLKGNINMFSFFTPDYIQKEFNFGKRMDLYKNNAETHEKDIFNTLKQWCDSGHPSYLSRVIMAYTIPSNEQGRKVDTYMERKNGFQQYIFPYFPSTGISIFKRMAQLHFQD